MYLSCRAQNKQQNKLLSTTPEAGEGCKHKSETSNYQMNIKKGIVIPPPQFCPHLLQLHINTCHFFTKSLVHFQTLIRAFLNPAMRP